MYDLLYVVIEPSIEVDRSESEQEEWLKGGKKRSRLPDKKMTPDVFELPGTTSKKQRAVEALDLLHTSRHVWVRKGDSSAFSDFSSQAGISVGEPPIGKVESIGEGEACLVIYKAGVLYSYRLITTEQ